MPNFYGIFCRSICPLPAILAWCAIFCISQQTFAESNIYDDSANHTRSGLAPNDRPSAEILAPNAPTNNASLKQMLETISACRTQSRGDVRDRLDPLYTSMTSAVKRELNETSCPTPNLGLNKDEYERIYQAGSLANPYWSENTAKLFTRSKFLLLKGALADATAFAHTAALLRKSDDPPLTVDSIYDELCSNSCPLQWKGAIRGAIAAKLNDFKHGRLKTAIANSSTVVDLNSKIKALNKALKKIEAHCNPKKTGKFVIPGLIDTCDADLEDQRMRQQFSAYQSECFKLLSSGPGTLLLGKDPKKHPFGICRSIDDAPPNGFIEQKPALGDALSGKSSTYALPEHRELDDSTQLLDAQKNQLAQYRRKMTEFSDRLSTLEADLRDPHLKPIQHVQNRMKDVASVLSSFPREVGELLAQEKDLDFTKQIACQGIPFVEIERFNNAFEQQFMIVSSVIAGTALAPVAFAAASAVGLAGLAAGTVSFGVSATGSIAEYGLRSAYVAPEVERAIGDLAREIHEGNHGDLSVALARAHRALSDSAEKDSQFKWGIGTAALMPALGIASAGLKLELASIRAAKNISEASKDVLTNKAIANQIAALESAPELFKQGFSRSPILEQKIETLSKSLGGPEKLASLLGPALNGKRGHLLLKLIEDLDINNAKALAEFAADVLKNCARGSLSSRMRWPGWLLISEAQANASTSFCQVSDYRALLDTMEWIANVNRSGAFATGGRSLDIKKLNEIFTAAKNTAQSAATQISPKEARVFGQKLFESGGSNLDNSKSVFYQLYESGIGNLRASATKMKSSIEDAKDYLTGMAEYEKQALQAQARNASPEEIRSLYQNAERMQEKAERLVDLKEISKLERNAENLVDSAVFAGHPRQLQEAVEHFGGAESVKLGLASAESAKNYAQMAVEKMTALGKVKNEIQTLTKNSNTAASTIQNLQQEALALSDEISKYREVASNYLKTTESFFARATQINLGEPVTTIGETVRFEFGSSYAGHAGLNLLQAAKKDAAAALAVIKK